MSWVLIMSTDETQRPPAVLAGYPTLMAAEMAGDAALLFGRDRCETFPLFRRYQIIPGVDTSVEDHSTVWCSVYIETLYGGGEDGKWFNKMTHVKERF